MKMYLVSDLDIDNFGASLKPLLKVGRKGSRVVVDIQTWLNDDRDC